MAECKVHMLAYPYGLCISLKLLGSLCCSLDCEASSWLVEREKPLCLTDGVFFIPLQCILTHRAVIPKKEASSIDTVTNSFFCCSPLKQKLSLYA